MDSVSDPDLYEGEIPNGRCSICGVPVDDHPCRLHRIASVLYLAAHTRRYRQR